MFHYGIFWLVHGLFVFTLPLFALFGVDGIRASGDDRVGLGALTPAALGIGTLAVVLSHLGSYLYNFIGRREYLRVARGEQMFRPYGRVVVMHLTILGGAFLIARFGMPVAALAVMVVVGRRST